MTRYEYDTDGTAYSDGRRDGAATERATIVAWLHKVAEGLHEAGATTIALHYARMADRIQRGEHRAGSTGLEDVRNAALERVAAVAWPLVSEAKYVAGMLPNAQDICYDFHLPEARMNEMIDRVKDAINAVPKLFFARRKWDKSGYEVIHELDPDGPIADETQKVVFEGSEVECEDMARDLQAKAAARAAIVAWLLKTEE